MPDDLEDGLKSWDDFHAFKLAMERPFWEPIGRYVFNFGLLEREVDRSLIVVMGVKWKVGEFTLRPIQSLAAKINLFDALARMYLPKDSPLIGTLDSLIDDLSEQYTFRNDLVHGGWGAHISDLGDGEPGWQKPKITGRYKHRGFNVTVTQITQNDLKIRDLSHRLNDLAFKAHAATQPPSHDKPE